MIDFAEAARWANAIEANVAEASWLVAADWFEEHGEDALAAELREVRHRGKACHLIRDRFFGFHPARNVSAANARHWFNRLTPVVLAAWASRRPGAPAGLSRRPVRVIPRPGQWLRADQRAELTRVTIEFIRNTRFLLPDGRRGRGEFVRCDYPIPLEAWGEDGGTRRRTIHIRFYVGHVPGRPDAPRYVLWPLHPADVRVRQESQGSYPAYPTTEDVTGITHPDQWGDLFTRPAPTDEEMDRELLGLVDPASLYEAEMRELVTVLARANGLPSHLIDPHEWDRDRRCVRCAISQREYESAERRLSVCAAHLSDSR